MRPRAGNVVVASRAYIGIRQREKGLRTSRRRRELDLEHSLLVDFDTNALVAKLRTDAETAVRENRTTYEESGRLLKFYEEGLGGYTYLE